MYLRRFVPWPLILVLGATIVAGCGDAIVPEASPAASAAAPTVTDPTSTWLTKERQDLLLSSLKKLAPQAGWVAGCVFESKANRTVLSAIPKPEGRAFYSEFTDPALGFSLVARVEGTAAGTGEFVGGAPDQSTYCYIPK